MSAQVLISYLEGGRKNQKRTHSVPPRATSTFGTYHFTDILKTGTDTDTRGHTISSFTVCLILLILKTEIVGMLG